MREQGYWCPKTAPYKLINSMGYNGIPIKLPDLLPDSSTIGLRRQRAVQSLRTHATCSYFNTKIKTHQIVYCVRESLYFFFFSKNFGELGKCHKISKQINMLSMILFGERVGNFRGRMGTTASNNTISNCPS